MSCFGCWAQGPLPFFRPIFAGSKPKLPGPILPKGHRLDTTQACLLACYPVGNDQTAGGLFLPRAPKASTPTCVPSSPLARPFSCMTSAHGLSPTVSHTCSFRIGHHSDSAMVTRPSYSDLTRVIRPRSFGFGNGHSDSAIVIRPPFQTRPR